MNIVIIIHANWVSVCVCVCGFHMMCDVLFLFAVALNFDYYVL